MVARTVPLRGEEKESLRAALDRHRDAVLWKVSGVSDADLRRSPVPSGTTLLGLVKHLAGVEYGWFCETFGRPMEPLPFDEADAESDLRIEPGESTASVLAFYNRARRAADQALDEIGLDETGRSWQGSEVSMRWVLIHMLEEVARHAGHADVLRELIDGMTGDHDRD